jgi:phosphoglycolate phosphatase
MMQRMFTHVIWDWNGTLLDDARACVVAINTLLERRKLPRISLRQYLNVFAFPVRDYYLQLGFDFSREDWSSVAEEYHAVYAVASAPAPLRKGAAALLKRLQAKGVTLSILSACELTLLRRMLEERGIRGLFHHVYGLSDLYAHSKVDLGHTLVNTVGTPRGEALLVGDTTHDFEVAQAIGVPCLLMTGGHQSAAKLRACGCPVVTDLDAVWEYIVGK